MNNKEECRDTCSMWKRHCNLWLLLFNTLLAGFNLWLLCTNAPRSPFVKLDFDYMGVIVAVLGVLLSVLVAWNIYTVVDFKSSINDVKHIKDKIREEYEKIYEDQKVREINDKVDIFNYVAALSDIENNGNGFFAMVKFGLSIVQSSSVLGAPDRCSSIISVLDSKIKNTTSQYKLGKEQKQELLDLLSSVRQVFPEYEDKYDSFYNTINKIEVDTTVTPLVRVKKVAPTQRIRSDAPYGFYSWE